MAIVWSCAVPVDEYAAAGRAVVVPRQVCPECSAAMAFWSGYERSVRARGPALKLWVRRARCGRCAATHALVPSFCLLGRLDVVEVVGAAVTAVVAGQRGARPVAADADVPHTTARGWVRRFGEHARQLAASFSALVVELTGVAPSLPLATNAGGIALAAIGAAFAAARSRAGPALPSLWGFVSLVIGGQLLGANTNSPSIVLGRRRLIAPVPDKTTRSDADDR